MHTLLAQTFEFWQICKLIFPAAAKRASYGVDAEPLARAAKRARKRRSGQDPKCGLSAKGLAAAGNINDVWVKTLSRGRDGNFCSQRSPSIYNK